MAIPAYLLVGDPFLAEEKRKSLISSFTKSTQGEISITSYSLGETKLDQVLAEARTLPFLIQTQVFVLKHAHAVKDKVLDLLKAYLENPTEGTILVFESDQAEKMTKMVKLIGSYGEVFMLEDRQKRSATSRFIQEKLKAHGKAMAPGALARLDEQVGSMPAFLDSILNQIISYAGDERVISEEIVEKFEEKWQEVDVFSLVNAIASRRMEQALVLLEQILDESGSDVYALMGLLHWQIKRLWMARYYLDQGDPESIAFKKCKVYPRQAPFFSRQLRNFSLGKLERALEGLFQIDWKIKTGRTDGPVALEKWVVETTS